MTRSGTIKTLLGAASLFGVAAVAGLPANADHDSYRPVSDNPTHWSDSVSEHQGEAWSRPIRVFVDLDARGYGRGYSDFPAKARGKGWGKSHRPSGKSLVREGRFESLIQQSLERLLPRGAILVENPSRADLRISLREHEWNYDVRTVDVDYRDKRYKGYAREGRGVCGRLERALYERVTDQARADFRYGMRVEGRFGYRDRERISGSEYEKYRYGRNLRATTPCGVKPVSTFPNSKVARYFEKADPRYQRQIRREVRQDVAERIAREIAQEVYQFAPVFRSRLAERYDDRYDDRYGWADYDRHEGRDGYHRHDRG